MSSFLTSINGKALHKRGIFPLYVCKENKQSNNNLKFKRYGKTLYIWNK